MPLFRRPRLIALVFLTALSVASAQDYPNKPVRILVPFPAGGAVDIIARQMSVDLTSSLGHSVVVDNRPGASGNIAMGAAAKAAPDGYTLVMASASLAINKQTIVEVAYEGGGVLGGYMMPGGVWTLPEADLQQLAGYEKFSDANLTKAKQMLAAAGVQDGLKVSIICENSAPDQASTLFIGQELKKLGMDAKTEVVTNDVRFQRLQKRDYDTGISSAAGALDDPNAIFSESYLTKSPGNYSKQGNQAINDLFLKQSTELNPERRFAMVNDLEKLTMPELGALSLDFGTLSMVIPKVVKNYVLHSSKFTNSRLQDV